MIIKVSTRVQGIKPELVFGLMITETIYKKHNAELVVTSLNDSTHKEGSKHYIGAGADLRIWAFKGKELDTVIRELKEGLGVEFDVVLEGDHIHIEFDPK